MFKSVVWVISLFCSVILPTTLNFSSSLPFSKSSTSSLITILLPPSLGKAKVSISCSPLQPYFLVLKLLLLQTIQDYGEACTFLLAVKFSMSNFIEPFISFLPPISSFAIASLVASLKISSL